MAESGPLTVFFITRKRQADVLGVHPDLVGPASEQFGLGVAAASKWLEQVKTRVSRFSIMTDHYLALVPCLNFYQGGVNVHDGLRHVSIHEAKIFLAHVSFPELRRQALQGISITSQQQTAAGFPIQPVDQFDIPARPDPANHVDEQRAFPIQRRAEWRGVLGNYEEWIETSPCSQFEK